MSKNGPAIVIAAYNRPDSLKRILGSIANACYPSQNVPLVISIDFSGNEEVERIAQEFQWHHGEKEVIAYRENLGLRRHILKCGDLTERFGNVILLEDDLYVSKYFYDYSLKAAEFYQNENSIAGISLYSQRYNEASFMAFTPLKGAHSVYFMQVPSSWGQIWSRSVWKQFKNWYETAEKLGREAIRDVPPNVLIWPDTSWKKFFFQFMIEKNLSFVYPYESLTTNFADVGTHHTDQRTTLQLPLVRSEVNWSFQSFQEADVVYDSYCEMTPNCLQKYCPELQAYRFDVDLYGVKLPQHLSAPTTLTSRNSQGKAILSFGRKLKPQEANIVDSCRGDIFRLVQDPEVIFENYKMFRASRNSYYYGIGEQFLLKDN